MFSNTKMNVEMWCLNNEFEINTNNSEYRKQMLDF